jgi:DNA-binding CsgD family transcriptional regulator
VLDVTTATGDVGLPAFERVLLERERSLARLQAHLAAGCEGKGSFVLVEGTAGLGKTALLDRCAGQAARLGMQVVSARGDEMSVGASFAAARELLWHRCDVGREPPVVTVGDDDAGLGGDLDRTVGILHGLYRTLAEIAGDAPTLAIVDDAHWLDDASKRFLAYLGKRLDPLPLVVVAARRPGEGPDPALAADPLSAVTTELLELVPLSRAAGDELVRGRLGPRADEALCEHCHWATGGNPFYLGELLAAIEPLGGRPTVAQARSITATGTASLARGVAQRLAALGQNCERLATAASVLGADAPLRIAAGLAELDPAAAERAADRLRCAGVLSDRPALSFAHPLVRFTIAEAQPISRRRALHRRAAQVLLAEAAPPETVAAHLLAAEPLGEQWVIDALRDAAASATARGAPQAVAVYLRRALAEPPAPEGCFELLRELGRAEIVLPGNEDSPALRRALSLAATPVQRAEVTLELAAGIVGRGITSGLLELAEPVLDRPEKPDPTIVKALEAILIGAAASDLASTRRVLARTRPRFDAARAGRLTDEPWLAPALAQTGPVLGLLSAAQASALAAAAIAADTSLRQPATYIGACAALYRCDRLEPARRALDHGIEQAERRGLPAMMMAMSVLRSAVALQCGELAVAEAHALRGHELSLELAPGSRGNTFLAQVLTTRGRPQAALDTIAELLPGDPEISNWQDAIAIAERGRARASLGQLRAGIDDLLRADARMRGEGAQLSVLCDWAPVAVGALALVGESDRARAIAERELAEAEAFGSARRLAAARSTVGALDPGVGGERLLRDAVTLVHDSPARLQYASSLLALGGWLAARGRTDEARETLAESLDLAGRLGASALATDTLAHLHRIGARPRRFARSGPDALTASELRAAQMAADGQSNREIARRLFVSLKTVEKQLSSAYRKLSIAGRHQLAAALLRTVTPDDRPTS